MQVIRCKKTDSCGRSYYSFDLRYKINNKIYVCNDITNNRSKVMYLYRLIKLLNLPNEKIQDFTADYIELIETYSMESN